MRVRLAAFFIFIAPFVFGAPAYAAMIDSQPDDSAQATRPPIVYVSYGGPFVPEYNYHAVGYIPHTNFNLAGVRFRVNASGGGDHLCPVGDVYRYSGTSTPISWNYGPSWGFLIGSIVIATTTPDIHGNCDYTTRDNYGRSLPLPLSTGNYYVFLMSTGGNLANWVSMSGKPLSSSTPQNFFGYRPATSNPYVWGTLGLEAAYFEFFDTAPPLTYSSPTITLLGSATTTVEFGSTFTDPGATAQDATDGDITSAIQTTGSVNTGIMGTTTLTYAVTNSGGLSATTTRAVIVACTHDCYSNVLFLPGIEGSRLYRPDYSGGTDKLWEPNIDSDVKDLYLNPDGTSTRLDIYTKERDVLDELPDGENIYKSFIGEMDSLKTSGAIADWEPIAYDWRLSLDDILSYGNEVQGRIYYSGDLRATSTPYITQELRHLAATSKTGKVSIVAHSNGGLLAKRLTEVLGPAEAARLIDKIIFVAVPQAGTPAAIAAGLHGYDQENVFGLITSKSTARTLANAAPMEYQLLPSASYFTYVDDPVVTFDESLTDWIAQYGSTVHSQDRLHQFLTDTLGRVDPETGDIQQPIQFSDTLLSNAEALHTSLDAWAPPTGVPLIQIAGWGVPKTVEGITYKKKDAGVTPEMNFTTDGDGTVVTPSALWTSTTGASNYWVDLKRYSNDHWLTTLGGLHSFDHGKILETDPVLDFLSDQITHTAKSISDYGYLSTEAPADSNKRLRFALHSPLTLNLYDSEGRHTGISTSTGQVETQIPGTYYTEFGDVKYLFSDASSGASVIMNGYDTGMFTLDVDEYSGDTLTTSTTFKDVPTTANTVASLSVQSDSSTLSSMVVDENGDGRNVSTIVPKIGETVTYTAPRRGHTTLVRAANTDVASEEAPVAAVAQVAPLVPSPSTESAVENREVATTTLVFAPPPREVTAPAVIAETKKKSVAAPRTATAPKQEVHLGVSQTASVYEASQQSVLKKLSEAIYNKLYGFWFTLKSIIGLL
ncbi:MAG: DUF5011 domain-containing protein [Candidatus Pacebacteria bacterium]|nr:DUF5011 domain-containing protein [Candidatus Paceibacterota bacterium]